MKRAIVLFIIIISINSLVLAYIPTFYGARSLSLGYSSMAFNYDINAIFINPALLTYITRSLSGYQFQYSYSDYQDFKDQLDEALEFDLSNFNSLSMSDKEILFSRLNDLFASKHGFNGFRASIPGMVSKDYGFSVSFVNTAIINPIQNDIFNKAVGEVTNEDIASLKFNLIGLSYTQYSLSYGLNISTGVSFGISLHYLYGKITEFFSSIVEPIFNTDSSIRDYLEYAWDDAEDTFYKLNVDLSLTADIGQYFKLGIIAKNVGNPTLVTVERDIVMERRIIAGIAFRPTNQWGIYLDMDINKTDLYYNGEDVQLISIGVEKGFFQNKLLLRAGFLSDLTEKYFLGSKSNNLYGVGFGFNMNKILVDFAIGIDSGGAINNIAISGFFMFQ
jgi:hypothetical protein